MPARPRFVSSAPVRARSAPRGSRVPCAALRPGGVNGSTLTLGAFGPPSLTPRRSPPHGPLPASGRQAHARCGQCGRKCQIDRHEAGAAHAPCALRRAAVRAQAGPRPGTTAPTHPRLTPGHPRPPPAALWAGPRGGGGAAERDPRRDAERSDALRGEPTLGPPRPPRLAPHGPPPAQPRPSRAVWLGERFSSSASVGESERHSRRAASP